ncbi:putative MFS family arabinose efflux permease [Alkalihalobacillus xiaoxiensis]|uniref:MFS family arabinose efflux permease n=1 Tax=Shouchella xiaoxiensis TaxID=766895 RepID=A0ABS2SZZ4_9BACI|nr:MFS transporter [Shouchella xiaoxiensis]MBM7840800.1 putative MFS family arabinose efflux permease [Shouchella xiaoxiensis]
MWKYILPGIALIGVTYAFARFSFGLFLPQITESLRLSDSEAGMIGSSAYLAYTLALASAAFFIKQYQANRVIFWAGFTAVIGLFVMAIAPNFTVLLSAVFIAGLGSGWASPAYAQIVSERLSDKQADRGNTWINSGTSFGLIISGPIALFFTEYWRVAFLLFAAMALIALIWNRHTLNQHSEKRSKRDNSKEKGSGSAVLARAKSIILAALLVGVSTSIYWTFSRSFLTVEYEWTTFASIVFWVLMGVSGVVGGLSGGIINQFGLSLSYRLTLVFLISSIFLLTVSNVLAVFSSAIFFGSMYIFMTGLFIVWSARLFNDNPSIGVSLSFLALGLGQTLGSFAGGYVIEMWSYPSAFILFASVGIAGFFIPVMQKGD